MKYLAPQFSGSSLEQQIKSSMQEYEISEAESGGVITDSTHYND